MFSHHWHEGTLPQLSAVSLFPEDGAELLFSAAFCDHVGPSHKSRIHHSCPYNPECSLVPTITRVFISARYVFPSLNVNYSSDSKCDTGSRKNSTIYPIFTSGYIYFHEVFPRKFPIHLTSIWSYHVIIYPSGFHRLLRLIRHHIYLSHVSRMTRFTLLTIRTPVLTLELLESLHTRFPSGTLSSSSL